MLTKGLQSLPKDSLLVSLCVCLSGCEDETTNREIRTKLEERVQSLHVFVASDTLAPLFACGHHEGVVLIAGTGSNCLLFSGALGGLGHVLGDEGSAFWLAMNALKTVIRHDDNYTQTECSRIKELVFAHFGLERLSDILDVIYRSFEKSHVASLCLPLSKRESHLRNQTIQRCFQWPKTTPSPTTSSVVRAFTWVVT